MQGDDEAVAAAQGFAGEMRQKLERIEVAGRRGGKTLAAQQALLEWKQERVRIAIFEAMGQFSGRPITPELRREMTDKAKEVGAAAARAQGIKAPRVVVDRHKTEPQSIDVRIAFTAGGRK